MAGEAVNGWESPTVCRVCALPGPALFAERGGYPLFRCARCRAIFVHPVPDIPEHIYDERYFTGGSEHGGYADYDRDKEPMRPIFEAYLADLERRIGGEPGRLLDVGAASGFFVNLALRRGWQAEGVELSAYAVGLAQRKALPVRRGTLDPGLAAPESFDAITMWDVLEHFPDPAYAMGAAYKLLREGGFVAGTTPDAASTWARLLGRRWNMLIPPEHLCCFATDGLPTFMSATGFQTVHVGVVRKRFPLPYVFHTLAGWRGGRLWKWLALKTDIPTLRRIGFPLNVRDNMYFVVQKPSV